MLSYIARRLLLMIPTLIGITFLVFMLIALSPGGIGASLRAADGQMEATSAAIRAAYIEDRYGLDAPAALQYARWLRRISPIKFGVRDQVTLANERISSPRPLDPPLLWDWFAASLPEPGEPTPIVWEAGSTADERDRLYRRAANAYAQARAEYIATKAEYELELGRAAAELGVERPRTAKGKLREEAFREIGPAGEHPSWRPVRVAAERALAEYGGALTAREQLIAAFRAKPYREAGVAVVPGVLSLATPDFGVSFSKSRPVVELIAVALPVTLLINLVAVPIIYFISIPMGMLAAVRRGTWFDALAGALVIGLFSFPTVLAGVLAMGFLASNQYLGAFPVSGLHDKSADAFTFLPSAGPEGAWSRGYVLDTLWHICLPVLCLVYTGFAVLSKQTRAAMLDNFNADYVRTAKAKGVADRDVIFRHVFRNSLLPLITIFVAIFPAMLSGSVIIEKIFSVPGMGSLVIDAINNRDRELVLATTLMIGVVNLLALLLADILYALADPRITYG
ncbi:MAG TPA: ABC transporter permease [Phycisphaerales bacterium]|nr:ABC transporter permease [Phycisphaerales bacterium]